MFWIGFLAGLVFTLIIAAVLASMLLPALNRNRETARKIARERYARQIVAMREDAAYDKRCEHISGVISECETLVNELKRMLSADKEDFKYLSITRLNPKELNENIIPSIMKLAEILSKNKIFYPQSVEMNRFTNLYDSLRNSRAEENNIDLYDALLKESLFLYRLMYEEYIHWKSTNTTVDVFTRE